MKPKVSILIPCYNAGRWLAQTLESALGQTWPNTEVIVVDDGSTDDSLDIARSFEAESVTVIARENRGACAARNRALREARGDYIQFLDADDLLAPNKIAAQVRRLQQQPVGAIATASWRRFYGSTPADGGPEAQGLEHRGVEPNEWLLLSWSGRALPEGRQTVPQNMRQLPLNEREGIMPPMAWLTPRSVIDRAGAWNEELLQNQDGEYFTRVLLSSSRIAFCPETEVYYRSGNEESISRKKTYAALKSNLHSLELCTRHMLGCEDSPRSRFACASYFQRFVYRFYPQAPDLMRKAERRAAALGGTDIQPKGAPAFTLFSRFVGWKTARRLQRVYHAYGPSFLKKGLRQYIAPLIDHGYLRGSV